MANFTVTASGPGSYLMENSDVGVILAGVTLSPDPNTQNIFGNPVILGASTQSAGSAFPAPLWLTVAGTVQSSIAAINLVSGWFPDGPPLYRSAFISVQAGGMVSQSSASGPDSAAISGSAANGTVISNAGTIKGDTAIDIGVNTSGDYTWGLTAIPYHWETSGFSLLNSGTISGLTGAAIRITGLGLATLNNSGVISGQGFGAAFRGDLYNASTDIIANSGTMKSTSAAQTIIAALDGKDILQNSGQILGKVDMGAGDDQVTNSGNIANVVVLGTGQDRFVSTGAGGVVGYVYGGSGHDSLTGGNLAAGDKLAGDTGNDTLTGNGGADTLSAGAGNDRLFGNGGDDILTGSLGIDSLYGGSDDDLLLGGNSADWQFGGAGDDRFRFMALSEAGDQINDFSAAAPGNDDGFQLKGTAFGGLAAGAISAGQFQARTDNLAQDSNDRFIFRTTDKTLWFDADGLGGSGPVMLADLQASATMTYADIVII